MACNRKLNYHKLFLKKILEQDKPLRIVDVGCAQGYFLKYCRDKYRHKVYGTEHTIGFVDYARNIYDLDIYDDIEDIPEEKFDLINCFHVLEHMSKPDEQLKKFHAKLADDGYLHISVPNGEELTASGFSSVTFDYVFPQQHLLVFTEKSLRNLLYKTGFKVVKINRVLYGLTVICQKVKEVYSTDVVMQKENYQEVEARLDKMKRAIGYFRRVPSIDTNYEKAVKIYPNFPDAWIKLIMIQKEIEDQIKFAKRATKALPTSAMINAQLGFIYFRKYDWEYALSYFLYSFALRPSDENILYHIALCYVELRDYERAKDYFYQALELNPKMFEQIQKMLGWMATQYKKEK